MKRILLCGANGFIGKNLLKKYCNHYLVRAVDLNFDNKFEHPNIEWIQTDLRNLDSVKKVVDGVDIVLHYAATTTGAADIVSKPYIHVTDNVVMTSLLIRESYEQGVDHFIMPSCTIMYKSSEKPVTEEDFESAAIPPEYYGAGHTKVYLEKMCKFFSEFEKTKYAVLRQSNVYGPHDKFDLKKGHVFAATVVKVCNADEKVVVWGNGEEERDLLYVDDLVNCIDKIINNQKSYYELINVGTGKAISISNLVQKIIDCSEKKLVIEYDETKPTIKTKLAVDITKAKNVFGWSPETTLEQGINQTLDWYTKENKTKGAV